MAAGYNEFFNPNLCHVCKRRFAGRLIVCNQCYMISYCSEKHKMQHWLEHMNICKSIAKYLVKRPQDNNNRYKSAEWLALRKFLIELVQKDLNRELLTNEMQMLICRRSCLICHQQAELRTCEHCCSAEFCNEHAEEFRRQHDLSSCEELLLLLNLNIAVLRTSANCLQLQFNNIPNQSIPYHDTVSFVSGYVLPARKLMGTGREWIDTDFIYTDYISGPLTLHYAMWETKLLNLLNTNRSDVFTVHVIAASAVDKDGVAAWELFLHFATKTRVLLIVMIGPELTLDYDNVNICRACQLHRRILRYECYPMLYHDYAINEVYRKPDIIVGFQAELDDKETWLASLRKLQDQNCPLILTATSLRNMQDDITTIRNVLGITLRPDFMKENKFTACRPYKDLQYDCVSYRNQYVVVYETLHHPNGVSNSSL
ncbi:PREDICTED: uncharacterized protein LOC106747645 [Dinoponera quadriceps]|uniref:Uncharacterized protein LOC106747645 n=1 Tax=Dinoponera quadriceps TaxID=609295 RepID=A0A6P3XQS1_DINQU|nr:PREDICTED: uncharacterized protein LOC106747645 [Dinoponera quadriceps]